MVVAQNPFPVRLEADLSYFKKQFCRGVCNNHLRGIFQAYMVGESALMIRYVDDPKELGIIQSASCWIDVEVARKE
jgi:hypothetical protein